jgi:hypothetical protein
VLAIASAARSAPAALVLLSAAPTFAATADAPDTAVADLASACPACHDAINAPLSVPAGDDGGVDNSAGAPDDNVDDADGDSPPVDTFEVAVPYEPEALEVFSAQPLDPLAAPHAYVEGDPRLRALRLRQLASLAEDGLLRLEAPAGVLPEWPPSSEGSVGGSSGGSSVVEAEKREVAAVAEAAAPARAPPLATLVRTWLGALSSDGRDRAQDVLRVLDNKLDNALAGAKGQLLGALTRGSDARAEAQARELVTEAIDLVHQVRLRSMLRCCSNVYSVCKCISAECVEPRASVCLACC